MRKFSTCAVALLTFVSLQLYANNAVNFQVTLSGDNEVPPVVTDTSGTAIFHVNQDWTEIRFKLDVNDADNVLGAAGAHLHCAPAGQNGGVVVFLAGSFPPGYDGDIQLRGTLNDSNIINPACGADIAELVDSMLAGNVYVNVHSTAVPSGVIRGQVQ
jgi:hypothetical protein